MLDFVRGCDIIVVLMFERRGDLVIDARKTCVVVGCKNVREMIRKVGNVVYRRIYCTKHKRIEYKIDWKDNRRRNGKKDISL